MADPPPALPTLTLAETLAQLRALIPASSPITNNDPFGVFETYLILISQVRVDDLATLNSLLPQGFVQHASGRWLDYHGESLDLPRIAAQAAQHLVTFTVRAAGTVPAGAVVQTELDAAGNALRFVVPEDTDVPATGGPVRVVAERAGSRYNVGTGRIQTLVTVLPFVVSVSNPTDSLVVAGVDAETDALYRERLRLRWPSISRGSTYHAYISWAREVPGITKVTVLDQHPRGQGTVDVIVAGNNGLPTPEQLRAVNALVQARRPVTADVQVRAPVVRSVDVHLRLYLHPGADQNAGIWEARVQAVFDALNIGEVFFPSTVDDALHNFSDVLGVEMLTPATHLTPGGDELIVPSSITVDFL